LIAANNEDRGVGCPHHLIKELYQKSAQQFKILSYYRFKILNEIKKKKKKKNLKLEH